MHASMHCFSTENKKNKKRVFMHSSMHSHFQKLKNRILYLHSKNVIP